MSRLERHWYRPVWWMTALLALPEGLFALLAALRRLLYRCGIKTVTTLPVPVVIIGNINVGGVGKTPLTESLLRDFAARGVKAGVISRGYGGSHRQPTLVSAATPASLVGDEPLLLAATGAPVAVGRDRIAAARLLLAQHPDLQLILSDDGLQHYALGRTLEIAVLDGERGLGNGHLLPAGPLREPPARLRSVDAIVVNGGTAGQLALPASVPCFRQTLAPGAFYRAANPAETRCAADFAAEQVVALAGIGNPHRFFATLQQQGVVLQRSIALPDHHPLAESDLPADADAVIVTAKDAVKLQCVNHARLWVLPVMARLEPDLAAWILSRLKESNGRKIS
ncbi:MAG: tetraacyldisaccharide 4'-kinase [Vogesella sp.]|uniref:tetraacyldisaccharide 4'-kinase n=1 Tax=Vogesella sp. TaxID=1904252 RepID=UPI00391B0897